MKFIKNLTSICILTMIMTMSASLHANQNASNHFFAELGGNGLLYSVNYEKMFTNNLGARIGLGYISADNANKNIRTKVSVRSIPIMATYLLGDGNHKFETGLGATLIHASAKFKFNNKETKGKGNILLGTGTLGYRYMPNDGGVTFKAAFTPLYLSGNFVPWIGVGVGFCC